MIAIVSLVITLTQFGRQAATARSVVSRSVSAECSFFRDLGNAPPTPRSAELGVKILVNSRNAFIGLGCQGRLEPPSAVLLSLAQKYHLTLRG